MATTCRHFVAGNPGATDCGPRKGVGHLFARTPFRKPGKYTGRHPGDPHSNVYIGRCWAHLNNTPFRMYKHYNHEGGTASPLIASWPAKMKAPVSDNQWIDEPTHVIDLMATCVDLAGATYPKTFRGKDITPMQGQSLRPLITGEGEFVDRALYWEHEGNAAIRVADNKLVRIGNRGPWELFNLASDRTEQINLIGQKPELAEALRKQWHAWATHSNVLPKPPKKKNKRAKQQTGANNN